MLPISTNFSFENTKPVKVHKRGVVGVPMYVVHYTYLPRCHIRFVYSKLGQRRLSGIAPFQDFMAHGRLQAAITAADIVLPLSLFLFFYFFEANTNSEIYHWEITHIEM